MNKYLFLVIFLHSFKLYAGDTFFENWIPAMSSAERAALEPAVRVFSEEDEKLLKKSLQIKDGREFRGIKCSGISRLFNLDDDTVRLETGSTGCYFTRFGQDYRFAGKLNIYKRSDIHYKDFEQKLERVKKNGFNNFLFVYGYDNEVKDRLKKFNFKFDNYTLSDKIPDYSEEPNLSLQITLLEEQIVRNIKIPRKSKVYITERDGIEVIPPYGVEIFVKSVGCSSLGLGTSNALACTVSWKGANINGVEFPAGTRIDLVYQSQRPLSPLSAMAGSKGLEIDGKKIPQAGKVIFKKGGVEIIPPPKDRD